MSVLKGRIRGMVGRYSSCSFTWCVIREKIIEIYSQFSLQKTIPSVEYDHLMFLYEKYKDLTLNDESMVDILMQEIKTWKIV